MQSKDEPPQNTSLNEVGETPTPNSPAPLRREAIWIASERHRGAMVAALCSLAGVGLGFGLGQLAQNDSCSRNVRVEHVRTQAPIQATVIPHTLASPVAKVTWLGVQGHTAKSHCGQTNFQEGARITRVFPGSPAHSAGLEDGDLITGVEGTPVMDFSDLVEVVREHRKGERVSIQYINSDNEQRQTRTVLSDISRARLR